MSRNKFSDFDDAKLRKMKAGILSIMIGLLVVCWVVPGVFGARVAEGNSEAVFNDDGNIAFTEHEVLGVITGAKPETQISDNDLAGESDELLVDNKEFFVNYRLERDRIRADQMDMLREVINNTNSTEAAKNAASQQIEAISKSLEDELMLETLLRSKGVIDAIVFVEDDKIDVILSNLPGENGDIAAEKVAVLVADQTKQSLEDIFVTVKNEEE